MNARNQIRRWIEGDAAWSRGARVGAVLAVVFILHYPFISHLRKALVTDHGDWLSIYNIAEFSWRTGALQADESEPIVRTQRYPPITRPLIMLLALPPKAVSAVLSFLLFAALYGWSAWSVAEVLLRPASDTGGGRSADRSCENPSAQDTTSDPGVGRREGQASDARVERGAARVNRAAAALLLLALVLPYLWADLTAGNVTSILLASVTAAFVWERRGRPIRAGVALSIGIMLKLIPLICLLYFLIRRRWRVGWGVLLGVLCIGLLPTLALFGPQRTLDYHRWWYENEFAKFTPLRTIDHPVECTYQNQAVVRTLIRLFTHTNAGPSGRPFYLTLAEPPRAAIKAGYAAIMGASLAGLLWLLWRMRAADDSPAAGGAYAVCVGAMLWFSPWVGSYYFTLMLWPAALVLGAWLRMWDDRPRLSGRSAVWAPSHSGTMPEAESQPRTAVGHLHSMNRRGEPRWVGAVLLIWLVAGGALASQMLRALGCNMWAAAVLLGATALLTVSRSSAAAPANAGDDSGGSTQGGRRSGRAARIALRALLLSAMLATLALYALPWSFDLPLLFVLLALAAYARPAQLAALAVSLLLATGLAEGTARVLSAGNLAPPPYFRPTEKYLRNVQYEARVDVSFDMPYGDIAAMEPTVADLIREPRTVRFRTDGAGYRNDNDYAGQRWILSGDSFVAGDSLGQADLLPNVLRDEHGVDAYSIAFPNDPDHYLMRVETFLDGTREDVSVLMFFFEGNDFDGPQRQPAEPNAYDRVKLRLADAAAPLLTFPRYVFNMSHRLEFMIAPGGGRMVEVHRVGGRAVGFHGNYVDAARAPRLSLRPFEPSPVVLKRLRAAFFIPTKYRVYADLFDAPPPQMPPEPPPALAALRSALEPHGVPVVDLTPALRAAARELLPQGEYVFWRDDTHWNGNGVRAAARVMVDHLNSTAPASSR